MADAARGAAFLAARPRLWIWVAAPFVAAAALLAALIWVIVSQLDPWTDRLAARLPDWLSLAGGVIDVALTLLLLLGGYVVFIAVASMIAAPFNEKLSEVIEEEVTGASGPASSVVVFVRELVRGLIHSVRRLVVYLATMVVLLLCGVLVPVVGPIIAVVAGGYVTARFASYDAYDAVFARLGWPYRAKTDYLAVHRGRTLGLGAAIALLLLVPFANLVALSVGAAGATLAYLGGRRAGRG
jgi:CysZ protein